MSEEQDLKSMLPSKRDGSPMLQSQLADDQVVAKIFVESGYFNIKTLPQALAKIIIGREMGLSAATAIQGLFIIEGTGKVGMETWLMQSMVDKDPRGFSWKEVEHTNGKSYTLEFFRKGESIGTRTWTIEDAARNNLLGKNNWKANPDNMLYWRCLARGLRELCNFTFGQMQTYTREEIEDGDFEDGPALPAAVEGSLADLKNKVAAKVAPAAEAEVVEAVVVEDAPPPKKKAATKPAEAPVEPAPSPEPPETPQAASIDAQAPLAQTVDGKPLDVNPETGTIIEPKTKAEEEPVAETAVAIAESTDTSSGESSAEVEGDVVEIPTDNGVIRLASRRDACKYFEIDEQNAKYFGVLKPPSLAILVKALRDVKQTYDGNLEAGLAASKPKLWTWAEFTAWLGWQSEEG